MDIVIRNVKLEDLEEVTKIQIEGWQKNYRKIVDDEFLDNLDFRDTLEKRKRDYQENGFVVAVKDDKIAGFCRYLNDNSKSLEYPFIDCEIMALYIKEDMKRCGIGTKLVSYIKEEFRKINKKRMVIWCLKDNFNARKFYEKIGGKELGEKEIIIGNKKYLETGYVYKIGEE